MTGKRQLERVMTVKKRKHDSSITVKNKFIHFQQLPSEIRNSVERYTLFFYSVCCVFLLKQKLRSHPLCNIKCIRKKKVVKTVEAAFISNNTFSVISARFNPTSFIPKAEERISASKIDFRLNFCSQQGIKLLSPIGIVINLN